MYKIMPRMPEQQMFNGKIMKMKKFAKQKLETKKFFAAAGGSGGGGGNDPFDNNKFAEFVKNLKKKFIPEDVIERFNKVNNSAKFQNIYNTINKIVKK